MGWGAGLIALACLCWALDNNFTRKVSASDALFIAGFKGIVAGVVNTGIALLLGARFPAGTAVVEAMTVGLLGYGISLVLFVLALRGLGSACTGAYFSTAPFMGAAIAILAFGDRASLMFWAAAVLMGAGVWLHLTERHEHLHTHEPITHTHRHVHDEHHQHTHDFDWDGHEPHTHEHTHAPLTHSHPHYPDIHHQHRTSERGATTLSRPKGSWSRHRDSIKCKVQPIPILKRNIASNAAPTSTARHKLILLRVEMPTNQIATSCPHCVQRDPHGQLSMTPTTAAVIPESAALITRLPRNASTYGAPRKIHRKHGVNVTQVVSSDRARLPHRQTVRLVPNASMKATYCTTMISGPGVVSANASPSSISPAVTHANHSTARCAI